MKLALAAFVLGLVVGPTHAQKQPVSMTGAQLVRDMLAVPDGGLNSMRRERAMGYIDGVLDATKGAAWCPSGQIPHELSYVATEDISRFPSSEQAGTAAPLILRALSKRYPCTPRRKE